MTEKKEESFTYSDGPERLDRVLAKKLAPLSRTYVQKLIKEDRVTVNSLPAPARLILLPNDQVSTR